MNKNIQDVIRGIAWKSLLSESINEQSYVPIDLSINNPELKQIDVSSSEALGNYIDLCIQSKDGSVGYGGYLETRNIYSRSSYFNPSETDSSRNIHLGLDLWIAAKTPIYAPLDARLHSFKNNTNYGDYGPTIILEHKVADSSFYTLYGHLSMESLDGLSIGKEFQKGEQIATLGDASVNGDYPPHLHFQIIKDLQGNLGDYPGVCSRNDLDFYKVNCPEPSLFIDLS